MAVKKISKGRMRESLEISVDDAIHYADMTSESAKARAATNGDGGIKKMVDDARAAVADMAGNKMGSDAFGVALEAAVYALNHSVMNRYQNIVNEELRGLMDIIPVVAARKGAMDHTIKMHRGLRNWDDLLDTAAEAGKERIGQPDAVPAVQAAKRTCGVMAETASRMTMGIIRYVVPPHAAAMAVFGAAIRDAPKSDLSRAIGRICRRMPGMARGCGHFEKFAEPLSRVILDSTKHCRTREAALEVVAERIAGEINRYVMMAVVFVVRAMVYTAAVAGAYHTTADKDFFESEHDGVLAGAYRLDNMGPQPEFPVDGADPSLAKASREMMARLDILLRVIAPGKTPEVLILFAVLRGDTYKTVALDGALSDFLALYRIAHRAGYDTVPER